MRITRDTTQNCKIGASAFILFEKYTTQIVLLILGLIIGLLW